MPSISAWRKSLPDTTWRSANAISAAATGLVGRRPDGRPVGVRRLAASGGVVRLGMVHYTTFDEVDRLVATLGALASRPGF